MSRFEGSSGVDGRNVLQFDELVSRLEQAGTKIFGGHFKIDVCDYPVVFRLLVYFFRDQYHATKYGLNLNKGLLLSGPIGCGKTSLMLLMRLLRQSHSGFQLVSCRNICFDFMEQGFAVIRHYGAVSNRNAFVFCFDDLGAETQMKYYGNDTNVMAEILLSRYDLFVQKNVPTHLTTNLSAAELESLYGNRVRSRLREMFNLIAWDASAKDKRA